MWIFSGKYPLDTLAKPLYTTYRQLNTQRIEQEKYITSQGAQRVGLVGTDTVAVMEWAWERKTNVSHP